MENERTDVQQFWSLPSGPAVIYLAYLLNAAPDWDRLRRLEEVSHGTKVTEEACGRGLGTEILFRTSLLLTHINGAAVWARISSVSALLRKMPTENGRIPWDSTLFHDHPDNC